MMKYDIILTSAFKKDLKKIKKQNKDLSKLTYVVNKLASGEILEEKYKDHELIDNVRFKNCRECHVSPDWLLIYQKDKCDLILYLIETGSHSDLF